MLRILASALIASLALYSASARAERLELLDPADGAISEISWKTRKFPVEGAMIDGKAVVTVTLKGSHSLKDGSLLHNFKAVAVTPEGDFEINVPVEGAETQVILISVTKRGEERRALYRLAFPEWAEYKADLLNPDKPYKSMQLGLGTSFIKFAQSSVPDIGQTAVTVKGSLVHQFRNRNWDLGISSFYTALPVSTVPASYSLRFFGFNLRAGYHLPAFKDPWRVSVLAGAYYTTMFTNGQFGFQNLTGPQLFPTVRRSLGEKDSVYSYLKYSPLMNGFSLLQLNNREIAFGAGWNHVIEGGKVLSISADVAQLRFNFNNSEIRSESVSLGVALGFKL